MAIQSLSDTGGTLTKNDLIRGAYSKLRISGITRQPTPEDLETALQRLESMAAQFNMTAPVGYNFEDQPDPNSDSGIVRGLALAFENNLAMHLIPDFNKEVPQILMGQASYGISQMYSQSAMMRLNHVNRPSRAPIGSGNQVWSRWASYYATTLPEIAPDITMFIGDVNDFTEHFDAYLRDGEDIASYSIIADDGIDLISDNLDSPNVNFRISSVNNFSSTNSGLQQITIIATTTTGRVVTKKLFVQFMVR